MEKKWTDEQQDVIDSRNRNLLVSAAAGAGKTAVLVERIIRMITDKDAPVDIDRLVIITFTKAAAAQMKQKISDRLEKMIEAEPENELLRRQNRLLANAEISTIDSFCLGIVRAYFQKLELDPAFRIADEAELGLVKSECMDELLEKYHEEANEDFYRFIEAYCGYKSEEKLTQYIYNLARKAEAQPWPLKWLKDCIKDYEIENPDEFDHTLTAATVLDHVKKMILGMSRAISEAKLLCSKEDGAPDYLPTIEEDEKLLKGLLSAKAYSDMGLKLSGITFGSLPRKKTGDPDIKKKVQEIRKKYKDEVKGFLKDYYFAKPEDIISLIKKSLPYIKLLVRMTEEYIELFTQKKREKNLIDFSDAEHFALDILWGETPECLEIRKQYSEIIIDEYQDSNNVQEFIANAIAGKCDEAPYVFTVGDVKQSIYKFRNACPELFTSKQKIYGEKKDNGELIILSNNFRSREEVLDSTNAVFKHIMRESIGGIDYNEKCFLKKGTDKQTSLGEDSPFKTEILLISKKLAETESADETETPKQAKPCRTGLYESTDTLEAGAPDIGNENSVDSKTAVESAEKAVNKITAAESAEKAVNKITAAENAEKSASEKIAADSDDEAETEEEIEGNRVLEARLIADRIRTLIYKERMEIPDEENEGKTRRVSFGDIVILLRTMKDWSSVFMETLEAENIPVFSDEMDGFFKSGEVTLVIDFLKVLDNPRQDIPFAAVLFSCIGKMTEEELAEIRINAAGEKTFYDAALLVLEKNRDREENFSYVKKLKAFMDLYRELEGIKQTSSVSELISRIYELTDVYYYYSAMPDGEKRKANMDMLPGYAVKFEETGYSGLFGFIRYYEKLKSRELDYGDAGAKAAGNCVRIMSIHKSKGLEFPVVFVAGLGKKFNFDDFKGDVFISSDNGIGIKYVDPEKRIKYPSFYHAVIKMHGSEEIIGEEMRLLYVAMTRAKDKLIMTGYTDKCNTATDYAALFKAKSYADFVFPVLEAEKEYFDLKIYSPETVMKLGGRSVADASLVGISGEKTRADREKPDDNNTTLCAMEKEAVYGPSLESKIIKIRNRQYRFENENTMPVKLSVSDLKHQAIDEEIGENIFEETGDFIPGDKTLPDFLKKDEAKSKGTDYGTLVHKCMQFIPMSIRTEAEVRGFLSGMVKDEKITIEESQRMPVTKFVHFLNSELAKRIRTADSNGLFYREKQFMILVKAADIDPDKYGESDAGIPVQGVIDAMFVENGKLVILDYKTDSLKPGEEEKLVKLYKKQLDIYAEAAGKLLGLPVEEKLLYSFSLEKTVVV